MDKRLIFLGATLLVFGIFWNPIKDSGFWRYFGKLPGDFAFKTQNTSIYFPIVTCLVISLALSLMAWILRNIFR
jgi:hypothetical protein